ncbi:multidrug effflux MFS transporter [Kiloniella majae]|uniref:multidrug effflux MFS transporter n=1 Tax=Kiloniella majae TaxID=1938558 RepID=UPI000A27846D|nr:multidrug effflux MFS transporter [Kiloniella majae]
MLFARPTTPLSSGEFIALMAFLMSLVALSIDAVMPALPLLGQQLAVTNPNDVQLVIGIIFFGLATGQIFFGPWSDSIGRKPVIYCGLTIFIIGSIISATASDFNVMLLGRLLQGIGASGPRTISVALVRDQFEGRAMARIMSFIMAVFIIVPTIAPALGLSIMMLFDWQAIFYSFFLLASIVLFWFACRQPETLAKENRISLTFGHFWNGLKTILTNKQTLAYTLAAGIIFGAFIGYLTSAQQIFQDIYSITDLFPLYFAILSLSIGAASLTNANLVMKFGMRKLSKIALITMTILAILYLVPANLASGQPQLWSFMIYMMLSFFCIGILFGNFNTLAMEPLGKLAGLGSAVVGSLTTYICMAIGITIGQNYDHTVLPLVYAFAILGLISLGIMLWVERQPETQLT